MTTIRFGRARIDGAATSLTEVGGSVYRLADVLPEASELPEGDLDAFFAGWTDYAALFDRLQVADLSTLRVEPDAFLAPLERPRHLIAIGTNYRDHIAEMGIPVDPAFPYAFLKPITTIAPPGGPVVLPSVTNMVDWEAELGVVIGRTVRNVDAAGALAAVAGYLPLNDVSARDWVEDRPALGIDWVMQKAHDHFTPLGPWITLASSISDPQSLPVQCRVNGELMQDGNTADMVFGVTEIVAHLSRFMTLSPGDIIATGTPAGVGFGRKPRRFIAPGDVVTVSLGELGSFDTRFVASEEAA